MLTSVINGEFGWTKRFDDARNAFIRKITQLLRQKYSEAVGLLTERYCRNILWFFLLENTLSRQDLHEIYLQNNIKFRHLFYMFKRMEILIWYVTQFSLIFLKGIAQESDLIYCTSAWTHDTFFHKVKTIFFLQSNIPSSGNNLFAIFDHIWPEEYFQIKLQRKNIFMSYLIWRPREKILTFSFSHIK